MSTLGWRKTTCKHGHVNPPRNSHGACIPCVQAKGKERYQQRRDEHITEVMTRQKSDPIARRDQQRAYHIGVTVEEIRQIIAASGMKCGACGRSLTHETLCVDHNHKTGRIRGVLCRFCNALEGMLTKQSKRVAQLLDYLARTDDLDFDKAIEILERGGPLF